MTSRAMSLYRIFTRSGQVHTPAPNSWANIALWRRFFATQDEHIEEGQTPPSCEADHNETNIETESSSFIVASPNAASAPIHSDAAVTARREFLMEHRRNLSRSASSGRMGLHSNIACSTRASSRNDQTVRRQERDVVSQPNIDIPVAGRLCTLSQ